MRGLMLAAVLVAVSNPNMNCMQERPDRRDLSQPPDQVDVVFRPTGEVQSEQVPVIDNCVDSELAGGVVCGVEGEPGATALIVGGDPVLAEWPDTWTLTSSTWSIPAQALSGQILVEPASNYSIPASFGSIVTDPGFSAWVLRLDTTSAGPGMFELSFSFALSTPGFDCLKGLDVTSIETQPVGTGSRIIIPSEGLGLDFTQLDASDNIHVHCLGTAVSIESQTWSNVKSLYDEL